MGASCNIRKCWGLSIVLVLVPLLLYASFSILPTHDDWAGTTTPDFNPLFIKERFLFYGYHWRPFDAIVGYIVGLNPQVLYPVFNHCLIVLGHTLCTLLLFRLMGTLGFNSLSRNIATLFFFLAPATMATVLAVDSTNQTYALFWDIIAFYAYIKLRKAKYIVWILLIFLATWSKENGLMWTLICPLLAYAFDFVNLRTLRKDLVIGIGIMMAYALAVFLLPKDIIIHPEYVPDIAKVAKSFCKFFFTSFITVDYIYLLHQPKRNLVLATLSLLLAAPFLYHVFIHRFKWLTSKKPLCIMLCLLIAVAPHIFTVFSMMHTYAGLPMVTLLIAYSVDNYGEKVQPVVLSFLLFLLAAVIIDTHLWHESVLSGLTGKKMAQEAVQKTSMPAKNVYLIIIEEDFTKLSSFCTVPYEAFGWGLAARHETNYKWPELICDTTIERSSNALLEAQHLGRERLQTDRRFDCVWIVNHNHIDVIKR